MRKEIIGLMLIAVMCLACVASAATHTTPFLISGYIFNPNGSLCRGVDVRITDLTTGVNWTAATHPASNYYRLVLDTSNVSTCDILRFNISNSSQSQTIKHTIKYSDIDNGGLTSNFTFASNGTTVPVPDITFVISGWTHYKDGTEYNNPVISITNLHTGDNWNPVTRSGHNYYRLILNTTDINSGDVLEFNLTDDGNVNLTNDGNVNLADHTITLDDINRGGLFDFNLTSGTAAIPDIAVEVELSEYMYPDHPDKIYVTVKNTGITDVGLFNLSLNVNDALVGTITINSLPAGEKMAVYFTWTPVETGNYAVSITADPEYILKESNRDNNKITKNVNVTQVSIIYVPNDHPTIQDAIDYAKPHTFIYIQESEYGFSHENFPVLLKDKHHLKLIGEGKHTKIVLKASTTIFKPLNMIHITNSSHIELFGFAAEVSGIEESIQICRVCIVEVENSDNVTVRNLFLYNGGYTECDNNAIKLVNSSDCRISGNLLSGKERLRNLGSTGTRGIALVHSNKNFICNNTIHRFLKCIDIQGDNNTIYFNNLYPHTIGGIYAVDSGCNNWNSTALIKYLFNGTIFRNYVGNHWGWEAAVDNNTNGIADLPYSDGTLTDHYPLIEPHGLTIDLVTAGIARPSMIYAGRNNTVLATIERRGTYPVPESLIVRLIANDVEVDLKAITVDSGQRKTVRFTWVPESAGSYDLKVDVQPENKIRELDKINNELLINVLVSSTVYNNADNVVSALDFLNNTQFPTGNIRGFPDSAWAALAITAAGEDPATGRWQPYNWSLIDYLRNDPKDSIIGQPSGTNPLALFSVNDFSRMILVTSAIGEEPTSFGDVNYLVMLKSFYDGQQFGDPDLVEDDALAILALVSCGDHNVEMMLNAASTIKDQQNVDMGWSSIAGKSDVKVTSLVIQALIASGENRDSQVITDALDYLKTEQEDDGGFSDARTTSYAIQAVVAAGQDPSTYLSNGKSPLGYLIDLQQDDGSFNNTMNMSLYPGSTTIFPISALHGAIHPVMIRTIRNDYELPDISIVDIVVENKQIVNTTTPLTINIKNNGGIFDVALFSDGVPVGSKSVRSVWSDSITPVSFNWEPDNTGTHSLTVMVDTGDRVRELYENNNRLTYNVNVLRPDLVPFMICPPHKIFVNATNNMTLMINGTTDEHFNVTLTADGVILLNRTITGIKNNLTLPVNWRPSVMGEHTLELVVDPGENILESNELNNVLTKVVNVEFPDLAPAAIEPVPIYVNASNKVTLSVEGTAEYFNVSLLENGTEEGKTAGIICYASTNVTVLWKPHTLGNCTLQAVVDCDNDIEETNESNNNISQDFTVVLPDIIPVQMTPAVLFLNETNRITIAVNGTAEGFNASLLANDTLVGKKTGLDTYNGSIWFDWVPDIPGTYNLTVCLDPDNDIAETNETNNNLTASIIAAKRIDLELISPLGGEIWTGIQNITWSATYEEPVSIDLFYTANLGYSWNIITANITNSGSHIWDTGDVIDGKYQVKVVARRGAVTEEDRSDLFYVYNKNSASEWGEFHSNAGFSLSETPDTNEIAWISDDIGAEGSSSLIVADKKIFAYCAGWQELYSDYTYLVALNELNGELLWGTQISPRHYGSWATPAYYKGRIYISSGRGVYCIDATKEDRGPVLWTFTFPDGGGSVNGGPAVADGKVYVGSWDGGHYYCLDARSGTEIWSFTVEDKSQSVPAVAYGRVYFGDFSSQSKMYSVDMIDAYEFWNTTVEHNVCGSVTVSDGAVYFTTYNFNGPGRLYALNAGNGTEIWKNNIIRTDSTPAFYAPSGSTRSYVYVASGCGGHRIYCFDVTNGELIWDVDGLGSWTNSPAVSADKKVFVGKEGSGGMMPEYAGLFCLDALTGAEKWHSDHGGSSPAIANGMVYTIGGGRVIAFGSTTLPDLTVERIYIPDEVNVGETVAITAKINNTGKSGVNESFSVKLTHEGNQIDKITVPSLDIGNVTNVYFNWTPQQTGNHHLMVTVDADETVTESDPMNNWCTADVIVGDYQVDLAVIKINATYVNPVGRNINITVHIENIGSETNSTFDVGLMVNGRHEDNETTSLLNTDNNNNNGNNNNKNRTLVGFNWTPDTIGKYSLTGTVCLDDDIDKTNNKMTIEIEVVTNETFFGYGPGYGGGAGGGSGGGIGSGDDTIESGEAGAGGMEYSGDTSSSVKEKMSEITGFLFGDASSGRSGGGGALPLVFIICLLVIIGLLYHGHRSEMRLLNDAKHHPRIPSVFRRKKS